METQPSQVPSKKFRAASPPSSRIVECVREFKLPQTFPSMVKFGKPQPQMLLPKPKIIANIDQVNFTNNSQVVKALVQANGKETQKIGSKLQKLKVKSSDGRDLGEIDVQILASGNRTVKITKPLNLPSTNQTPKAIKDGSNIVIKSDELLPGKVIRIAPGLKTLNTQPNQMLSAVKYLTKPMRVDAHETPQGVLIPIPSNVVANSAINNNQLQMVKSDNSLRSKTMLVQQSPNGWQMVKFGDSNKSDTKLVQNTLPMIVKPRVNGADAQTDDAVEHQVLQQLKPAENQQKVKKAVKKVLPASKVDDASLAKKRKLTDDSRKQLIQSDKKFISIGASNIVMTLENVDARNKADDNAINEANIDDLGGATNTDNSGGKSQFLRTSQGTVNLIRRSKKENLPTRNRDSTDSQPAPADSSNLSDAKLLGNGVLDDDISSKLSIVGEALSTIGDEDLRAKALKALADCGIGLERFIPIKPPNQMGVKESQCQTNVFGLISGREFVRVTGDTENIERLQEVEKHNALTTAVNEINKANQQKETNDNAKFCMDLNKMLDTIAVNKTNVDQVREILKVNPLVERAYNLLQRDFKNCKVYDKNGLLNIHKAVLSNNPRAVKRQIMVLKNCKESVDLKTSDGQTSLELAVRHEVSPVIVDMLLQAGASPTAEENAHDSALTLASRYSSPVLFQLIQYLSSKDPALNNVDTEGFTALHYCAINGNEDAITALIRVNVDLNARDCKSGRTALFHALENDYLDICKELVDHGAKGNIPNFAGHTVFTLFNEDKHYILREALQMSMK